ncbi:hypothetical protein BDW68DRAFT_178452 [Aspergillus falconensis]
MAKRFDALNMRSFLYLQDSIAETDSPLAAMDDAETPQIFLSSGGMTAMPNGKKQYEPAEDLLLGNAVLRYQTLLELPLASAEAKASMRNWVLVKKRLVRSESAALPGD